MIRYMIISLVIIFFIVLALLMLTIFTLASAGDAQQIAYGAQSTKGAPWYVMLAIIIWPAVFAIGLTIASAILVRRVNRAAGNDPLPVLTAVKWTIGLGVLWGPMLQWGLQEQTSLLTGMPINWKLVAISPFITGVAAMICYDVLRAYTNGRYPKFYALLSVKHEDDTDYTDSHINGDLTRIMEDDEDKTDPKS